MWHALADNELEIFQKYVDEFNAQSKLAEVELVYTPADEYIKQLTIGNIAGDMADLVMMDNCYTSIRISIGFWRIFLPITMNGMRTRCWKAPCSL